MLNVKLSDKQNKSVLSLALATVYRPPGPYTDFLKEFADFLSDILVNVDKALIVGDFNIHVDNTNDALGLAFTDLINSFGVKQNVTGPTHRFNHTLDLIISHGIDLTDIDIIPQSDDVTDHFLVSCMLHITDINYMAPRYRPGRIIIPATKDRFTNNLPDLSQLLCVPINTDELDTITSNMVTIFSNALETVAPIKLKKVREKRAAPWYSSYTQGRRTRGGCGCFNTHTFRDERVQHPHFFCSFSAVSHKRLTAVAPRFLWPPCVWECARCSCLLSPPSQT